MDLLKQQLRGDRRSTRSIVLRQLALFVMFVATVTIMIAVAFQPETAEDEFDQIADTDLESMLAPAAGGNDPAEASNPQKGFSLRARMREQMGRPR